MSSGEGEDALDAVAERLLKSIDEEDNSVCDGCVSAIVPDLLWGQAFTTRGKFIAGAAALASAFALRPVSARASQGVDIILRNAMFLTMDSSMNEAQALAISGDRIIAIGSDADVVALRTKMTRIVDLDGRTVLPGLIDPHQHPISAGVQAAFFADCGPDTYKTKQELIAGFKEKIANVAADQWFYAGGYDNLLQGGDLTLSDLDEVSTTASIFVLWNNSHTGSVNTAAMRRANVTASSPDKPAGGAFGRDANGALNGVAYETNMLYFLGGIKATPQAVAKGLISHFNRCASVGLTTIHEAGSGLPGRTDDLLGGYQKLVEESSATIRFSSSPIIDYLDEGNAWVTRYGKPGPRAVQVPGSLLSFYAVKIVGDGSNQTETAGQTMPYLNSDKKGTTNYTKAQFVEKMQKAKSLGWPLSVHSNGDATLDIVLDAIEEVYGPNSPLGVQRIEHCTITRPEQLERMAKLGVQPSFLINHVYYYGAAYRDQLLGPERASRMDPSGQALALNLPFTFHSDAPVTRPGPMQMIGVGVTRRCETDGSIVGAEQGVPIEHALRAMTTSAAGQIGLAHELGSLEVGKAADLTILVEDPRKVDPQKIKEIEVSETWVAGRRIAQPTYR